MAGVTQALPASYMNANNTDRMLGANIALVLIPTVFIVLRLTSRFLSKAGYWVLRFALGDRRGKANCGRSGMITSA